MAKETPAIFSIGHSNHSLETFLELLKLHHIEMVVDVRSQPYGWQEHFNREIISAALKSAALDYLFMGRELGARREEAECYDEGVAIYEKIAELPAFQEGLKQLRRLAQSRCPAIMCAEKEPLDCHRAILICRRLRDFDLPIKHILADGALEDHAVMEKRLVRKKGIQRTLFEPNLTNEEILCRAYEQRGREIAFRYDPEEIMP
ncbi:MAG: DUF488 domain-containing protein [Thermoguttaceae bacterium]